MPLVYHKNNGLRDRPVGLAFRAATALLGLPWFCHACALLLSYLNQSGHPSLWKIAGSFAWSFLWLWPAATGYVFPQWRAHHK
jgi:hypothetical protein